MHLEEQYNRDAESLKRSYDRRRDELRGALDTLLSAQPKNSG
jgi:hypothetical protein